MRNSNSPPSYGQQQQPPAPGGAPTGPQMQPPQGALPSFQRPNSLERGLDPAGMSRGNFMNFGNIGGTFKESARNALDPLGAFGGGPKRVKGNIDPTTGTVTVGNYGKNNDALSAAFTNYLRTGDKGALRDSGGAYKGLKKQIQALQDTGWKWGTPSAGAPTVLPGQGPLEWSGAGRAQWGQQQGAEGQGQMMRPAVEPGGQSISEPPNMQIGGGGFAELNPGGGANARQASPQMPQTGMAGFGQAAGKLVQMARARALRGGAPGG